MRAIITGANAGIGKDAAVQLAQKGYQVTMACRNPERAEKARREVIDQSGSKSVEVMLCDTSSQRSIRSFCEAFARSHDSLDVLINNAAHFDVARKERESTDEGFDTVWATNHLGPFLLSMTLAPLLERSDGGRILNVTSKGLVLYPFLELDLEDPSLSRRKFSMQRSYYHSKLAVLVSTIDLAERLAPRSITVNAVRVTNVKIDVARYPDISELQKRLYAIKSRRSIEPAEMAETYIWLATSDEAKTWSGKHVDERRRVLKYRRYELRKDVRQALYELSMRSVGLATPPTARSPTPGSAPEAPS